MDAKLTLKLDKDAIELAKRYAKRRGLSLSRVVESYFLRLAQSESPPREKLTGVVAELAGVLRGAEIDDFKEDTEYLQKKPRALKSGTDTPRSAPA